MSENIIATAVPATAENAVTFASLGLAPAILKAVEDAGYTVPSPIQAEAIPQAMAGHDLMASAQTGTGKTAAFILPALHKLSVESTVRSKGPRVLVLTPTRELAQQVSDAANKYGKNMRVKVVSILGGMPYPLQNKLLSGFVDILVATPGRLIDHIERGRIDFSRLEMLVLDEADRMLDMGFIDDVERIAAATPATRQTLLFSATLEGAIGNLAMRLLKSPKRISVAAAQARHENIEQRLMYVDDMAHKNRLLDHLLRDVDLNQALVFTATKRDADMLADELSAAGHAAAALHGDMNQRERNRTLLNLRRGNVRVLVATDVAARGIDVAGITHVINFDLPKFAEDYVHRIGRTGRAGASGIAVSFASNRDAMNLKKIERFTGQPIKAHTVEGMEPKFKPRPASSAPRGGAPRGNGGGYAGRNGNGGGYAGRSNNGGNFNRHAAPDSRHEHSQDQRREGHKHSRFSNDARPARAPFGGNAASNANGNVNGNRAAPSHHTAAPHTAARRPQGTSFALGRGHNSGNKR
ncbi:MAG: DEAD/DEAH box helicase [Gammaproteobacteria bacterium]|nr:DEAD/DEAH box helicase [Gammaproteobacteria bacterium]MBU1777693.1 DEAD/DEAH box helicase [Gammaproteobacteria bacterium]MBU1969351.1 DEAD/DEAH box helicase [Gammaproteobacteria bacterium]